MVALQPDRSRQTAGKNTNELPQQDKRSQKPHTEQLLKCKLLSMKRKQEFTMLTWTFKNIINGRFQMSTTLRRGKFIIYEPLKGKVQKFKTLHWNSVFNMGPRLYNYMPKAFRDLKCDYLFFEMVLKHFLHNIVPNNEEPILNYLPDHSTWSIPISLGKTYWDSKTDIENKRLQSNQNQQVMYNKKLQTVHSGWKNQLHNILGTENNL